MNINLISKWYSFKNNYR